MESTTETKLSKHLSAAVNAIQKEIDKKDKRLKVILDRITADEQEAENIREECSGLEEQISKLKGE